jgi:O-antigen/teichoic acid export membrane protein
VNDSYRVHDKSVLVGRNAVFLIAARVASTLLLMVLQVWITRALGPVKFSSYAFAVVVVANVYGFLTDFGARYYTTREVALNKSKMGGFLVNGSVAKAIVTAITLVPMLLFVYFVYVPQSGREIVLLSAVACGSVILKHYVFFLMAFYDGCERMHVTAVVNVGESILIAASVGLALFLGASTAMPLLLSEFAAMVVASAVVFWLALRLAREFKASFDWAEVRDFCLRIIPFGLYFLFGILYFRADGFMLAKLAGKEATGLYFAVVNPLMHFEILARLGSIALYPTLSKEVARDINRGRKMFGQAMRVLFTMGLPIVLGCTLFADKLAIDILGVDYAESGPLLMVVAWVMLFRFPAFASNTLLFAMNKQAFGAVVAALFAGLNVGMNFVLIPRYGAMGAAVASVITCSGVEIVRYIYVRALVGAPGLPRLWAPALCSGIVMVGSGLILKAYDVPLIPVVIIEALVYMFCLFIFKGVNKDDIATARKMLQRGHRSARL